MFNMSRLNFVSVLIVFFMISFACKSDKKILMSGDEPVAVTDIVDFFQPLSLNFQITDERLKMPANDSLLISKAVFTQLIPDSVLSKVLGRNVKSKFYPIGKINVSENETYLIAKSVIGSKSKAYIIFLGKKFEFVSMLPFLEPDSDPSTSQSSSIDKRFSISKIVLKKHADGSLSDGKDVYAFDFPSKSLILILTEALDEKDVELINPIDTFKRENKFSADYSLNKKNLVSVRDGRKPDMIYFFIHIEKDNGDCKGELKGEASFINSKTAIYNQNGDPCSLELSFSPNSVRIKELDGCGLHRGLNCHFDGSFPKKKNVKKK